jgi:succinate-acetate transporter protein
MKTTTVLDRIVRGIALLTAFGSFWVVLGMGIMANDSNTTAGAVASIVIISVGVALCSWVVICSLRPSLFTGTFYRWYRVRFVLVIVPVYAFALAGIWWCVSQLYWRHRVRSVGTPEVKVGETSYPTRNPNAMD